jgi:hypothetical protein
MKTLKVSLFLVLVLALAAGLMGTSLYPEGGHGGGNHQGDEDNNGNGWAWGRTSQPPAPALTQMARRATMFAGKPCDGEHDQEDTDEDSAPTLNPTCSAPTLSSTARPTEIEETSEPTEIEGTPEPTEIGGTVEPTGVPTEVTPSPSASPTDATPTDVAPSPTSTDVTPTELPTDVTPTEAPTLETTATVTVDPTLAAGLNLLQPQETAKCPSHPGTNVLSVFGRIILPLKWFGCQAGS